MKTITIFLLAFVLIIFSDTAFSQSGNAGANHNVTIDNARLVAKNHYFRYVNKIRQTDFDDIHFPQEKIIVDNSDTLYYVFNCDNNKGFVIVASDYRLQPILGYSFEGNLNDSVSNSGITYFLDIYKAQIEYVKNNNLPVDADIQANWDNYFQKSNNSSQSINSVAPLLSTTWAQGCYYNGSCPGVSGGSCGKALVGCVATMMGQIMKYWNYPANGIGSHTYTSSCCGPLTADFGNTTYHWSSMTNSVTSTNSSVATLLFHCGVSVDMNYGANASAAMDSKVRNVLVNHFNYSSQASYLLKSNYTTTAWNNLLKTEIDNGRPVAYTGQDINGNGGHAFVLDGYQGSNSNYFHFNFGWGGTSNGYFYVTDIYPSLGGLVYHFNNSQAVTIKIFPNLPAPPVPTISSNSCGPKTLTRTTPPSGAIYYWQGTSCGTSTSLGSASNFTVSSSGTYYLSAKYSNGSWSTCSSKIVTIIPLPNNPPAPTTTTIACGNQTLTRGVPPTGITFYWQGTSCGTGTGSAVSTYTASASGTYYLRARSSAGCWSGCSSIPVIVNSTPTPIITGQNSVCSNTNGVHYSVINSGNTYSWSITGGTIASGQNTNSISVNWGTAGSGAVTITETNSSTTCSKTISLNVNINSSLNPSIISSGSTHLCQGQTVMLDASAGFLSYLWSNGDTTQTITVSQSGIFSVSVTSANGCNGSSTMPVTVTVHSNPIPIINPAGITTFCDGDSAALSTTLAGIASYYWSTGEITPGILVSDSGSYSVTVTDTNGCTGSSSTSATVIVNPLPPQPVIIQNDSLLTSSSTIGNQWYLNGVILPGATSPNYIVTQNGSYSVKATDPSFGCFSSSDSINFIDVGITPINFGTYDQHFIIYPNPATNAINITYDNQNTRSLVIRLLSLNGQLIYQENLYPFKGNYTKQIDMQNVAKGIYFIKIITDSNVIIKKLIRE